MNIEREIRLLYEEALKTIAENGSTFAEEILDAAMRLKEIRKLYSEYHNPNANV